MNRKQRRAARHSGGRPAPSFRAGPSPAAAQTDLFQTAVMHHHAGALAEAERCYRQVLAAFPGHAEAHSRLGAVLMRQGRTADAIAHIEQAVALNPTMFEAYGNLAQAYLWAGQSQRAIEAACQALDLKETPQSKAMFAQCVGSARFNADDGRYRRLVLRALVQGWVRPRELTHACISLVKLNPAVADGVARALAAWPARVADGAAVTAALAKDELLRRLLECDPTADVGLERLLTNVRHAMLKEITLPPPRSGGGGERSLDREPEGTPPPPPIARCASLGRPPSPAPAGEEGPDDLLAFYCSIARQCFINEYVFATTKGEDERVQDLRAALEAALEAGEPVPALWPVAVAAYFPLHAVTNAQALLEQPWPASVRDLLVQQVEEPAEEKRLAATISSLTSIDNEVSRAVRQQYEQNPYPRWAQIGPPAQPAAVFGLPPQQLGDVLIAGCGTGLSAIEFARHARGARILAIDLSLASLSYAKRMAKKFELTNLEFAQADILQLGSLGRRFDFIDASGVLHHLTDPWEGWRILLSLLRPGGAMQVGLYSGLARRNIVAARAIIAERGYRPIAEDIRRCREEIMASEDALLKSISRGDDFFTTSECRDLLFHVQEHRVTVPEINSFLAANGVEFGGFFLDVSTHHRFATRFPQAGAALDLDRWHVFETEAPATFSAMYQFAVRKPPVARIARRAIRKSP